MTIGDWCPRCGFPRRRCHSDEAAYVAELQKARDELIKERDEFIKERDELKADLEKAKIEIIERDMTTDWADDAIDERDRLKAELEEAKRWQTSDSRCIHCTDWWTNKYIAERDEARHWARKFYKQIMESEDDIFFIARMLRNYEAYKQYIAKLSGDA